MKLYGSLGMKFVDFQLADNEFHIEPSLACLEM